MKFSSRLSKKRRGTNRYEAIVLYVILMNFSSSIVSGWLATATSNPTQIPNGSSQNLGYNTTTYSTTYTTGTKTLTTIVTVQGQLAQLAAAAGCSPTSTGSANCGAGGNTAGLTGSGGPLTGLFQYVAFVGDWITGLGKFVEYFALGILAPGQFLTAPPFCIPGGIAINSACGYTSATVGIPDMITAGIWLDYFLYVILFLRGGRIV